MAYPMGEAKLEPLRVDCDRSLGFSSRGVLQRPVSFFSAICQFWQFPTVMPTPTIWLLFA